MPPTGRACLLRTMITALLAHPDSFLHEVPEGHPERPARLDAVLRALESMDLLRVEPSEATDEQILRAHPPEHLEALVAAAPHEGLVPVDADTWLSPGSLRAARLAAGAAVQAVDMVMAGEATRAFCAMRPPGHHAEQARAMGFCLLGNVAIAAKHALDHHGLSRVAIVDFDVHHGNGTQALVQDDPRILFASTHQMPLYPGTGAPDDRGPHGTVINVALSDGTDGAGFRAAVDRDVMPAVDAFVPELLFISAGFDAHARDPLAGLELQAEDFGRVTRALCDLADIHAGGRVVSVLEGGYDLRALGESVAAHVDELAGRG